MNDECPCRNIRILTLFLAGGRSQRQLAEPLEQRLQLQGGATGAKPGGLVPLVKLRAYVLQEGSRECFDLIKSLFHKCSLLNVD